MVWSVGVAYLEKLPVTGYEPTKELARLDNPGQLKLGEDHNSYK